MLSFVTLSQGAPSMPHEGTGPHTHPTVLAASDEGAPFNSVQFNNNHQKSHDCVKKWMTPGHTQFVDHNPHVQSPEIVDKIAHSFWIKPEADHCNQPAGRELQYIYDSRPGGGGAAWVNCTMQPSPDRMQYSTEIKKFTYYTFTEGTCASLGDKSPGCTHGTATKVKDCTRKPDEPNKGTFQCDQNVQNTWEYFPQTDKWYFAYFEEYKKTIGRVTLLGKDCDCGVHKSRASLGAKLASWMIWTQALAGDAVNGLANGHLPAAHPVVAYIGDFAHDQNYNGGAGGSRWPRAPELGAEAIIEESPPAESFGKGALHFELGLPPCIHYYTDYGADKLKKLDTKDPKVDGDGDLGPYGEGAPAEADDAAPQR